VQRRAQAAKRVTDRGWLMFSFSAARVALRSCMTASNTTRRLRSIWRQFMAQVSRPRSEPATAGAAVQARADARGGSYFCRDRACSAFRPVAHRLDAEQAAQRRQQRLDQSRGGDG